MAKISNREKLLTEGLRVVHERGLASASVRDIVQAAGVPQGSFTNHFASKEAFSLEILDLYFAESCAAMERTLRNPALPPLKRIETWLDANRDRLGDNMRNGCLLGNFSIDAVESAPIRGRLVEIFQEIGDILADCLKAAVETGDLPKGFACDDMAKFVLAALQGSILMAKAENSPAPIDRFRSTLFGTLLR